MPRMPSSSGTSVDWAPELQSNGYAVIPAVLEPALVERLKAALNEAHSAGQGRGGRRNVLELVEVRAAVRSAAIRFIAERALGPGCFAVRGLLFEKTPTANWRVAWHQDLAIATKAPASVDGFGPWTTKAGPRAPAELIRANWKI